MAFLVPNTIRTANRGLSLLRVVKFDSRCAIRPSRASSRLQVSLLTGAKEMSNHAVVDRVIEHWFGSLDTPRYHTFKDQQKLWYGSTKEIDDDIRGKFGSDVEMALEGKLDYLIGSEQWPITAELALVVLLDQYPRNIYRGTGKAFAGDSKSREVVMGMLTPLRWSTAKTFLPPMAQASFLLPLMHQESVADLDLCAAKVDDLIQDCRHAGDEAKSCLQTLQNMHDYSERHKEILVKFGRYPYRNAVLGRESTQAELAFLENGPRFGQ